MNKSFVIHYIDCPKCGGKTKHVLGKSMPVCEDCGKKITHNEMEAYKFKTKILQILRSDEAKKIILIHFSRQ